MRFRSDIQGLRAVAVIPVLLYHFGIEAVCGGFTGVDIFFTISGFVIAGSIFNDIRADRFSIADFYFKRIRRIFPALGAVLIATTIAAVIILLPDDLISYARSLLATVTFWSNVYFLQVSGYFAAGAQLRPLLHTWSLSIEEQFYVVAPIAFALIHRYGRARWLLFLAPVALGSLALGIVAVFFAPTAGFFLLPTRAWELLIGAIVALHARPAPRSAATREVLSLVGVSLILAGLFGVHESDPFPGWNALLPCVGTALILQAGMGVSRLSAVGRLLSAAPFRWVGNISYSLYLVHWPIVALYRYATLQRPDGLAALVMLVASIGLATLSWRFVEQPFRHVDRRFRGRVLGSGIAMIAAIALVATIGIRAQGFPGRFPGYVHRDIPGNGDWGGERCFNMQVTRPLDWDPVGCTRIHGSHGRILLWGDSFAAQYIPGILRDAPRIDADVLQYTFAGCPPILGFSYRGLPGCSPSNRAALSMIRRQRIDTVVLSSRWSEISVRNLRLLHETIGTLRAMGLRVFVFGQSPEFVTDVQQIDYISGNRLNAATARWKVAFSPIVNSIVADETALGGGIFVDTLANNCKDYVCPYRIGRQYLYSDYGHMSTLGSTLAVRRYFPSGTLAH